MIFPFKDRIFMGVECKEPDIHTVMAFDVSFALRKVFVGFPKCDLGF